MKLSKEITNGLIICAGIVLLFLIVNLFGLEKVSYLRVLNALIVYYGINRTQKMNQKTGNLTFGENLISMFKTGIVGVVSSVIGLAIYATYKGGNSYLESISYGFMFGKNPTLNEYCFGLLIEGIASVAMLSFIIMQSNKIKSSN